MTVSYELMPELRRLFDENPNLIYEMANTPERKEIVRLVGEFVEKKKRKEEAIKQVKILIKRPTLNRWTRNQFLKNILEVLEDESL